MTLVPVLFLALVAASSLAYVAYAHYVADRNQRSARALVKAKKAFGDEDSESLARSIAIVSDAGSRLAPPRTALFKPSASSPRHPLRPRRHGNRAR